MGIRFKTLGHDCQCRNGKQQIIADTQGWLQHTVVNYDFYSTLHCMALLYLIYCEFL